ncbi:HdeD family acid-resistance protein [Propionibacterium freudenreichii]|uniref:HdeD family acid-resistance protein n=1 Tax=Propionibacterium freudenreichii TaxID=1744 RepID=UPI0038540AA5
MTDQSHLSGWDVFRLNAPDLTRRAITTVRASFALLGVLALGLGIALLAWPGKTIIALAMILGAYLLVEGVIRIVMALVTPLIHAGSRLLSILFGVLFILGGVVMMRNPGLSGETLLVVVAIIIGVAWIMEGVLALLESGSAQSRGWAIAFGLISLLAGIIVLVTPAWSAVMLMVFTGASLVVMGIVSLVRAFTFGREVLRAQH